MNVKSNELGSMQSSVMIERDVLADLVLLAKEHKMNCPACPLDDKCDDPPFHCLEVIDAAVVMVEEAGHNWD